MPKKMSGHEAAVMRRLRTVANKKQKGLCYWCRQPMRADVEESHPRRLTAEHIVPLFLGGQTKPWNIAAACRECNGGRHQEMNSADGGMVSIGDQTVRSPFECLEAIRLRRSTPA